MARYLLSGHEGDVIVTKFVLDRAVDILKNIWSKATCCDMDGYFGDVDLCVIWRTLEGVWEDECACEKSSSIESFLKYGPKNTMILLDNPVESDENVCLWDILTKEDSYKRYLEYWG